MLLGAGGVGKTTLAAGYAVALASEGRRVGLLGIDPARRLQDTIGVQLADAQTAVPGVDNLAAAVVEPQRAIARWFSESVADDQAAARLARNPFFRALSDQLGTATDVLAAVRLAEWRERDPLLTDLVVDTAPGLAAVDFLRAPARLQALVGGRMVRWLLAAARASQSMSAAAHRVLTSVSGVVGTAMVADLAEFFALVQAPLSAMLARLDVARRWLHAGDTRLLLVTSTHDTAAAGAVSLSRALASADLHPHAAIVNRTWPAALAAELDAVPVPAAAEPFVAYVRAHATAQAAIVAAAAPLAPQLITLPALPDIDRAGRDALAALGATLHHHLQRTEP